MHWTDEVTIPKDLAGPQEFQVFMDNLDRPGYLWDPAQILECINQIEGDTVEEVLTFAGKVFLPGESKASVLRWYRDAYDENSMLSADVCTDTRLCESLCE